MYQLDSCSTCARIRKELGHQAAWEMTNIKEEPLTPEALDHLAKCAGSYEALFSRRAMKYRTMGLATRQLSEADFRQLLLEEYTFLKRPVILVGDEVFVGSSRKTVAAAKACLGA